MEKRWGLVNMIVKAKICGQINLDNLINFSECIWCKVEFTEKRLEKVTVLFHRICWIYTIRPLEESMESFEKNAKVLNISSQSFPKREISTRARKQALRLNSLYIHVLKFLHGSLSQKTFYDKHKKSLKNLNEVTQR